MAMVAGGCSVLSLQAAGKQRAGWQRSSWRVVFTNGCFDLLHVGHVRYLQAARQLGDLLVVALNDDESVRRLKGPGRPFVPLGDRAEVLCSLRAVDFVVPFGGSTAEEVVRSLRPDVYVKGGDYDSEGRRPPEVDVALDIGAEVEFLPLVVGRSTSSLVDRIRAR